MRDDSALAIFASALVADGCDLETSPNSGTRAGKPATVPGELYRIWFSLPGDPKAWRGVSLRSDEKKPRWVKRWRYTTLFVGGAELDAVVALRPDLTARRLKDIEGADPCFYEIVLQDTLSYGHRGGNPTPGAHLLACLSRLGLAPATDPFRGPTHAGGIYRVKQTYMRRGTATRPSCPAERWIRLAPASGRPTFASRFYSSRFTGGRALNEALAARPDLEAVPLYRDRDRSVRRPAWIPSANPVDTTGARLLACIGRIPRVS